MGRVLSLILILVLLMSNSPLFAEGKLTASSEESPPKSAIDPKEWKIPEFDKEEPAYNNSERGRILSFARNSRGLNISIPKVELHDRDLDFLVSFLKKVSRNFDPDGEGLNFAVQNKAIAKKRVSLSAQNMTIRQVLEKVSKLAGVDWVFRNNRVLIGQFTKKEMMIRQSFWLSAERAMHLGNNVKDFFIKQGVLFPKHSSIHLIHGSKLLIFNLKEEHDKISNILRNWREKNQFAITAQLLEVNDSSLKKGFGLSDILSLPTESFKVLNTIMAQSLEGQKGLSQKGGSFLDATFSNDAKGVWDCRYNWRYKEGGKNFELTDKIKVKYFEDKVIELGSKKDRNYILLLSTRLVDPTSSPLKTRSLDALQPSGKIYIFSNEKLYQKRVFLPKDQDQFIENYYKLKKTK
jgi:hypothetical protein